MVHFGLIGARLGHSLSPQIHQLIFKELGVEGTYDLLEIPPEELYASVHELRGKYCGVNVTIPHKINVMAALTTLSMEAQAIGAGNTIHFHNGAIRGYNTDYAGFGRLLENNGIEVQGKSAAVLGTGGASRAVLQYLIDHGVSKIFLVSRNTQSIAPYMKTLCSNVPTQFVNYVHLERYTGDLLINCTPVGMYPKTDVSPVGLETVEHFETAVDLIYNPAKTLFLQQAEQLGKKAVNGMLMLVAQAVAAEEIWLQREISNDVILKVAAEMEKQL